MSAHVSKNPVEVLVNDLNFHTDKENSDLTFYQSQGFKSKSPDVFKYINLMHEIVTEQETAQADEMQDSRGEFKKLRSDQMLQLILDDQKTSLNEMRRSEKIFDAATSEIGLVFKFMKEFSNVRNTYFKNVLGEVDSM